MSQQIQMKIRTTEELRDKIHRITDLSGRSVNSEINYLLEKAISGNYVPEEKITAEEARKRASISRLDMSTILKEEAFQQIHASIMFGRTDAYLSLDNLTISDEHDPIIDRVLNPLINELKDLGYEIEVSNFDSLTIKW